MQAEPQRSMWRLFQPTLLFLAILASVLSPALASRALAQSTPEKTLLTRHFTIIYPEGEEASAEWYAGFADDVIDAVCEMLGSDPLDGLTLHIYATEDDYITANPIAADHAGIMAHAIPGELAIGVAVERLRQVAPEIARESFRHEITHVVAGELSGQNLPIGFQEGLAQYNELSITRAQSSAQMLKNAQNMGIALMSWRDLNDRFNFQMNPDLGYPQAYSVMAFLVDRFGMDYFARYLAALKENGEWYRTMFSVYGFQERGMLREYYRWLPGFLETGWQNNLLTYYDLSPGVALYEAGQFTEAAAHFTKSEELYTQLGRTERAADAAAYLEKAERAGDAALDAEDARQSLESYNYRAAHDSAQTAKTVFTDLGLTAHQDAVDQTLHLAEKGMGAVDKLDSARKRAGGFDFVGARSDAQAAGQVFGELGDTARASQAAQLATELSRYSVYLGVGVLAVGLAAVGAGAVVGLRRHMRTVRVTRRISAQKAAQLSAIIGKESGDWL